MFWHYIAILRELLKNAQLWSSRYNIVDGRVVSSDVVHAPRHETQHALGPLPEDGNVMPKYVEATIHN
jgi:hypothetical protein